MFTLLPFLALGHITMVPNSGSEAGNYFFTQMKIPHGHDGMFTSRIELLVPHGILSLRPEVKNGWNVTVIDRELPIEEQYSSHGSLITKAPERIVWQAISLQDMLHTDHLMLIGLQLKIGCSFSNSTSNTLWQDEYTLWFRVVQHSSYADSLDVNASYTWTGIQADQPDGSSPSWSSTPYPIKPSPYVFVYPGTRCDQVDATGPASEAGITSWFGVHIPAVHDKAEIEDVQHVKSIVNELFLDTLESQSIVEQDIKDQEKRIDANRQAVSNLQNEYNTQRAVGLATLSVACFLCGVFVALCSFRLVNKKRFSEFLVMYPLQQRPMDRIQESTEFT